MNDASRNPPPIPPDDGLRRMLTWVFIALVVVVLLAVAVVELTLRSAGLR